MRSVKICLFVLTTIMRRSNFQTPHLLAFARCCLARTDVQRHSMVCKHCVNCSGNLCRQSFKRIGIDTSQRNGRIIDPSDRLNSCANGWLPLDLEGIRVCHQEDCAVESMQDSWHQELISYVGRGAARSGPSESLCGHIGVLVKAKPCSRIEICAAHLAYHMDRGDMQCWGFEGYVYLHTESIVDHAVAGVENELPQHVMEGSL